MAVLVTGVAGAVGLHVAGALLRRGEAVMGVDLPAGGDPALREARLAQLRGFASFSLAAASDGEGRYLAQIMAAPQAIVHLAEIDPVPARRITAQLDLLERCAAWRPALGHLVQLLPAGAEPDDRLAAAVPAVGRAFARLHGLPQTVIRLAETYGLWSEPRGTLMRFADAIAAGRPVYLAEDAPARPYLWLDDAAAGLLAAMDLPPDPDQPFRRLDLAGPEAVEPERVVTLLEQALGRTVERRSHSRAEGSARVFEPPVPPLGWSPRTGIEEGVLRFAGWYRERRQVT